MRLRFLILLLVLLTWAWLFLQQHRLTTAVPSAGMAAASVTVDATDTKLGAIDAEVARLPQDRARRLYERIMEEFRRGDCRAAEAGFRMFLEIYRDSSLVPYADFWRGECAYREGRYQEAVEAFDRTVSGVPLSRRLAAAAFMKKGLAYAKLGKLTRSRNVLELVVAQFPESEQAAVARRTLLSAR